MYGISIRNTNFISWLYIYITKIDVSFGDSFFSKLLGHWPQCLDRSSNGFFDHIVNYIRYFVEYFFFRFRICIDDLPVGIIYQFFVILSNFGLKSLGFIPKNQCIYIIFELKNSKQGGRNELFSGEAQKISPFIYSRC